MSTKNFVSYGDAETLFTGIGAIASNVRLNTQDLTTLSRTKNLLPMTVDGIKEANTTGTWNGNAYTVNGVTYTINTDSNNNVISIGVKGTCSNNTSFYIFKGEYAINSNNYTLSIDEDMQASQKAFTLLYDTNEQLDIISSQREYPVSITNKVKEGIIFLWSGAVVDFTISPMLRLATETDTTFVPYIPSVESRIEDLESGLDTVKSGLTNVTDAIGWDNHKNLIPMTVNGIKAFVTGWNGNSLTSAGITFTILTDEHEHVIGIRVNGTSTYPVNLSIYEYTNADILSLNGFILNGNTIGSDVSLQIVPSDFATYIAKDDGNGSVISYSGDKVASVRISITAGKTVDGVILPMVSKEGGVFEPYHPVIGPAVEELQSELTNLIKTDHFEATTSANGNFSIKTCQCFGHAIINMTATIKADGTNVICIPYANSNDQHEWIEGAHVVSELAGMAEITTTLLDVYVKYI